MSVEPELQAAKKIPVASMVESIVGCKWSVRLLQLCAEGHNRPGKVLRACPGLSAKVMNERWRKMIRFGIMRRMVLGQKPPVEVEYQLTPFGRRFLKILDEVRRLQEAVDVGGISETTQTPKKAKSSGRVMPSKTTRLRSAPGSSSKGS
ncbi:winged helix-turn-helix transcriptional regulator [Candidatus Nitrospira allomarina]|jgi:DNA-binding HxlR family transcriptional regulator|uniref:Winged helix-turn-helix transcriptional regulator n=1 Tax=Candidatus Nitrospira allomarina TaxID=3020900 RepID=A0AA96GGD8_9BACT|nr:winged helix-turn-helix transcriptional regulator [Candidatus Nitrospira allomarina]WNM58398.1 winged helix-turn-helix transcriptional regulator [Candidatus Nitrospira allomarina]